MVTRSKVRLSVSVDEARQAILDALPKDAVVREEDDGVGRFAGQRTLVILGRGRDRLLMFHGTYGTIKRCLDEPHLDVSFDTSKDNAVATLVRKETPPPSALARMFDVLGYAGTVAAALVAYYSIRSIPFDVQRIALVAAGGGVGWAVLANMMPKREEKTLHDLVDAALKPITKKKKKKKASKPDATDPPSDSEPPAAPDSAAG